AMVTGYFNGDGRLDLATSNRFSSDISVLLGNGDGTFQAQKRYTAGAVYDPFSLVAGDLRGDGRFDLATLERTSFRLSVLLNNGDGTFTEKERAAVGSVGSNPFSLVVEDFNGDGRPDVATANWSSPGISVLLGHGDGTFQPQQ